MEIKVGDKVRVREDAPKVYQKGSVFDYTEHQSAVHELDGDAAIIGLDIEDSPIYSAPIAIPSKYLIKVEDEAKEPKFKEGDKAIFKGFVCTIIETVYNRGAFAGYIIESPKLYDDITVHESDLEPYTESAEEKIIRQREAELNEFAKEELDRVHHPEKYTTYEATIDNVAMDWTAYTADLAKEIALKVANKYNGPEEVADYAVKVAKAVVEGLKK